VYKFSSNIWKHNSPGGWFFISLPIEMSDEIRQHLKCEEEGWGRLNVTAVIGDTQWDTAIWYDTKHHTYLLPIKSEIRKKENIISGSSIEVSLLFR
jgi:hypothetical protein